MRAVLLLGWESRELDIVMPIEDARAMYERARRFDVDSGGRFGLRNDRSIVLRSAERGAPGRHTPVMSHALLTVC
jgi:hypothetical protein